MKVKNLNEKLEKFATTKLKLSITEIYWSISLSIKKLHLSTKGDKSDSLNTDLKTLRCSFPKNVILSYININSIRNKLDNLQSIINNTVDILAIAEPKIDDSFPMHQKRIFTSPH